MMLGTVIRLMPNRGFGFVRGEDGLSRFFNAEKVVPPAAFDVMREGSAVEFTPREGGAKGNGLWAEDVAPLGDSR